MGLKLWITILVARNARKELEKQTGKAVVSPLNAKKNILTNSLTEIKGSSSITQIYILRAKGLNKYTNFTIRFV